ncbi:MAG TPA: hypothetical protein VF531_02755 [Bacillota bacterium]
MKRNVLIVGWICFFLVAMPGTGMVWAADETGAVPAGTDADPEATADVAAETKPAVMDYGSIENSVYRNDYLGMSLPIPGDWQVQGEAVVKQMLESGKEVLPDEDKKVQAALDAAEQSSLVLLTVFRYPLGTQVEYNPSMVWVAEKVELYPGIQVGKDYLLNVKRIMESGQVQFQFNKEIYPQVLGGVNFDTLETQVSIAQMTVYQRYYATVRKGYAISFVISYTTEDEAKMLENILTGLKFVQ